MFWNKDSDNTQLRGTCQTLLIILKNFTHPTSQPFITEEIWQIFQSQNDSTQLQNQL